jgi:hypothetical protein
MSKYQIIVDELRKLNSNPSVDIERGEGPVMQMLEEEVDIMDFIDKMKDSTAETEQKVLDEFKMMELLKKEILVEMMKIVVKMGEKENSDELVKQKFWLGKLQANI